MKIIEKHGISEIILTQVLGWKWVSFIGKPTKDNEHYPGNCRVRQLLSPKAQKSWEAFLATHEGREADMTEPLSYAYCSSRGPEFPPRLYILVDDS